MSGCPVLADVPLVGKLGILRVGKLDVFVGLPVIIVFFIGSHELDGVTNFDRRGTAVRASNVLVGCVMNGSAINRDGFGGVGSRIGAVGISIIRSQLNTLLGLGLVNGLIFLLGLGNLSLRRIHSILGCSGFAVGSRNNLNSRLRNCKLVFGGLRVGFGERQAGRHGRRHDNRHEAGKHALSQRRLHCFGFLRRLVLRSRIITRVRAHEFGADTHRFLSFPGLSAMDERSDFASSGQPARPRQLCPSAFTVPGRAQDFHPHSLKRNRARAVPDATICAIYVADFTTSKACFRHFLPAGIKKVGQAAFAACPTQVNPKLSDCGVTCTWQPEHRWCRQPEAPREPC